MKNSIKKSAELFFSKYLSQSNVCDTKTVEKLYRQTMDTFNEKYAIVFICFQILDRHETRNVNKQACDQ